MADQQKVWSVTDITLNCLLLLVCTIIILASAKLELEVSRKKVWNLLNNVKFWIYSLELVVVVLTVARFPLFSYNVMEREVMTVVYNWGASLIVCISTIVPRRLLKTKGNQSKRSSVKPSSVKSRIKKRANFAFASTNNSTLVSVLLITAVHVLLLGISAGLYFGAVSDNILFILLTLWRCIFCFNVSHEIWALLLCMQHFHGTTLHSEYRYYLVTTLYLRIGICITLVFKFLEIGSSQMNLVHMFLIISSLLAFHRKTILVVLGKDVTTSNSVSMASTASSQAVASTTADKNDTPSSSVKGSRIFVLQRK
mmetsp:Transcript_9523/g.14612  ORF Transcript_9523/g.14612 Transcript_9523/m.14612 type:complete len:311 (-) Transcript_9523:347-1279(-)